MPKVVPNQAKKHWSFGLVESMKDPNSVVKKSELVVVIKDKYPKAKLHYLVLPRNDLNSIYDLNKSHIDVLEEFGKMYEDLKRDHSGIELRAGFHAVPSMMRLHMHVISTDMISTCLKTKQHWNSFTTDIFLGFLDVLTALKENGFIKKMSNVIHQKLLSLPLKCNQCDFKPKNMPNLKQHLLSHET